MLLACKEWAHAADQRLVASGYPAAMMLAFAVLGGLRNSGELDHHQGHTPPIGNALGTCKVFGCLAAGLKSSMASSEICLLAFGVTLGIPSSASAREGTNEGFGGTRCNASAREGTVLGLSLLM